MAFQYVLPQAVTSQLESLRGRIRRVAFLRGCGLFLTLSCGLLIGTLLIDFLLDLESASRLAGFVVFCVVEVVLSGFLLVRPLVIRLTDPEVALLAEEKFPELGERVSSLVELADPDVSENEKGSPLMRDLLEEETLEALARCDFNEVVSTQPAVRRLSYGFGTLSFLVLSLLIFPSVSSLLLARLFNPWGNYESVSRLLFEIEGADEFVARGDDIQIVAKMTWRNGSDDPVPEPVQLSWRSEDGNSDVRTLGFDPDLNAFTTSIPDVQDSLEFFVSSEGSRSKRYRINVLDRPEVLTAKLEITPPGYLGQPRETLDGVTGEISVFEHSKLIFDLTFSRPVEEASINWLSAMVLPESEEAGNQQAVPLQQAVQPNGADEAADDLRTPGSTPNSLVTVDNFPATQLVVSEDGLSATLKISATIQGAFAFLLKESHGIENSGEPYRQLIITRDQPPVLEVPGGEQDRAKPTDVYGIRVSAVDDVALEELELHVSSREGLNKVIQVPSELLGQESLEHEFRIDFSDIAVKSGDFLKLQIRAADGRPTPSPNEVWSNVRYVAISDDASAQGTSDVLARQEQIRKELQDIRNQLQAAVREGDDLRDDARQSLDNDRKFAQQQAVENLAGREEELAARMAELADEFSEHPLFANLSEDLWRMAADELDPAAAKLAASSEQELKDQMATLDENSAVADMVEEGLASVAAKFEKLADLEEDLLELNRIAQRANQLADDAGQLEQLRKEVASQEADGAEPLEADAAQRQEEARQDLAENQQLLMEEQSELMAALDNLIQQRPELLEAAREHQLEKLADLARQASEIAEPQELLAESLKNDAEQTRLAAASGDAPKSQDAEGDAPAEPLAKVEDQPAAQNSSTQTPPAQTPAAESSNAAVSEANSPAADQQPNAESATPQTSPSIGELLAQQEELTAQAAQLALQTAQEEGADAPATQSAADSAQQSEQAEAAARGGQFAQAASQAADAQQAAEETADVLQESSPALADQARQLASQQQRMAEAFEQLENSPAQRAAARQEQQRELAAQADQVAQALDELAEQLGSQPLDLQQQSQQASSAQQSAQQGQQAASQAAQNLQAGNQSQAAQAAQQAADSLRQSAQQAGANATPSSSVSPVPGEFAAQITDAMRQLQAAQQRLAQAAAEGTQAGQSAAPVGSETGEATSADGKPGAVALDAATGEAAVAQPPSSSSPSSEAPAQERPSQNASTGQSGEAPSPSNAASDNQPDQPSGQPAPETPGSNGQPGSASGNQPGQQTQQRNGALAQAADALQQAAEMLSDAAQQLAADGSRSGDNQGQSNQQPSGQQPGLGNSGTGAFADGEIKGPLDTELKRRAMKNWGQLPGNLKTEILQSSQRKANGDYAKLIKLYFEELAKAGQADGDK